MVALAVSTQLVESHAGTMVGKNAGWAAAAFIFLYCALNSCKRC